MGLWEGEFDGIERLWLRWYDAWGNWALTEAEQQQQLAERQRQRAAQEQQRAEQERQRAEQQQQRAEQEQQRADTAEDQLRQVVVNLLQANLSISQIANMTGLTEEQVRQIT